MVAIAAGATVASSAAIQLSQLVHPVSVGSSCMPSPSSAVDVVEKFKEQLLRLTLEEENGALSMAIETLEKLESFPLTREVLEITRIGATVNEIRRKSATVWPEVSKRCRGLIKAWQRVAEVSGPVSSCDGSSNGGTPSMVSPAFGARRGVTPQTPSFLKQQRVSSTGMQYTSFPSSETSPSIRNVMSSYAPMPVIHKSASVGVTLFSLVGDPTLASIDVESQYSLDSLPNGSEASTFAAANRPGERTPIPTITLKRTRAMADGVKTAAGSSKSGSGSPPIVYHAVSAARRAVQSTAQLVAQMSENLPDHIPAWDLTAIASEAQATTVLPQEATREAEVTAREKPASQPSPGEPTTETLTSLRLNGEATSLPPRKRKREDSEEAKLVRFEKKERKRLRAEKREQKKAAKLAKKPRLAEEGAVGETSSREMPPSNVHLSNGHDKPVLVENGHMEDVPIDSNSAHPSQPNNQPTSEIEALPTPKQWYDHLIPAIVGKLEMAAQNGLHAAPASLTSSTTISAKRRQLTLLPYLDVGAPDFEEHHFPDRNRYIAERRPPLLPSGKQ